jgi:hypothetical protein
MWWAAALSIPEREIWMAKNGAELLKIAATSAGLLAAVAAAGGLLSVKAAPEPPGQSSAAQADLKPGKTFASICKSGEIVAGMAAAKRYAASADEFQGCIRDFLTAERARADKANKPLAMPLLVIENHRLLASEKDKKLVESRMRAEIVAFNEYGSECPD